MDRETREIARQAARSQAGMTLLEILIVLGIIALVMGFLVGPQVMKQLQKSRKKAAWNMTQNIDGAYAKWAAENDGCPSGIDDLKEHLGKRKGDDVKDPWGHQYVLKCDDEAPEECEGFCSLSMGPDGKEGTGDDIKSWVKQKD